MVVLTLILFKLNLYWKPIHSLTRLVHNLFLLTTFLIESILLPNKKEEEKKYSFESKIIKDIMSIVFILNLPISLK